MGTYVNNLRLLEITTGDESGTWGTKTNTNLELIADAFGSGTEAITTNADTHTTTVDDGVAAHGRAIYMKYTGTLDSACTITLAPNTINKLWIIENATSGSQNIIISQGSGANITIGNGNVSAIFTDGVGGGAGVFDALADLELSSTLTVAGAVTMSGDASVGDDLTLVSDAAVLNFGENSDVNLTHVHDTGLLLNSTMQLQFNDSSQYINAPSAAILDINATDEIELNATAVDLNGTLDVSGNVAMESGVLSMGTTPSATGSLRMPAAWSLQSRRSSSGDGARVCMGVNAIVGAEVLDIGDNTTGRWTSINFHAGALNTLKLEPALITADVAVTMGLSLTVATDVIIGTNPADSGDIRLNKNFGIFTRNNANDANKVIISENTITGNDTLDFGDNGKWAAIRFHVSTANVMELTSSAINLNKAVTANNAAFKLTGLVTSDPGVAGQLWNSSGDVKISAG